MKSWNPAVALKTTAHLLRVVDAMTDDTYIMDAVRKGLPDFRKNVKFGPLLVFLTFPMFSTLALAQSQTANSTQKTFHAQASGIDIHKDKHHSSSHSTASAAASAAMHDSQGWTTMPWAKSASRAASAASAHTGGKVHRVGHHHPHHGIHKHIGHIIQKVKQHIEEHKKSKHHGKHNPKHHAKHPAQEQASQTSTFAATTANASVGIKYYSPDGKLSTKAAYEAAHKTIVRITGAIAALATGGKAIAPIGGTKPGTYNKVDNSKLPNSKAQADGGIPPDDKSTPPGKPAVPTIPPTGKVEKETTTVIKTVNDKTTIAQTDTNVITKLVTKTDVITKGSTKSGLEGSFLSGGVDAITNMGKGGETHPADEKWQTGVNLRSGAFSATYLQDIAIDHNGDNLSHYTMNISSGEHNRLLFGRMVPMGFLTGTSFSRTDGGDDNTYRIYNDALEAPVYDGVKGKTATGYALDNLFSEFDGYSGWQGFLRPGGEKGRFTAVLAAGAPEYERKNGRLPLSANTYAAQGIWTVPVAKAGAISFTAMTATSTDPAGIASNRAYEVRYDSNHNGGMGPINTFAILSGDKTSKDNWTPGQRAYRNQTGAFVNHALVNTQHWNISLGASDFKTSVNGFDNENSVDVAASVTYQTPVPRMAGSTLSISLSDVHQLAGNFTGVASNGDAVYGRVMLNIPFGGHSSSTKDTHSVTISEPVIIDKTTIPGKSVTTKSTTTTSSSSSTITTQAAPAKVPAGAPAP